MAAEYTHLRAALAGPIPDLIIATWQELAAEHVATGQYRNYLTFEKLFPDRGPDTLAVTVANTAPHARVLEDGHAGFHLPSAIDWGGAMSRGTAKVSKKGVHYLHVPFRHTTPGRAEGGLSSARRRTMMPQAIYRDALAAAKGSAAAAKRVREAGPWLSRPYGAMSLAPGLRGRTAATLAMLTVRAQAQEGQPGYTWRSRKFAGMKRLEQVNPESGARGSTWMTWRTLSETSVGWFIPAAPGYHFAERTADRVRAQIAQLAGEAARADLETQLPAITVVVRGVAA